MEIPFTLYLLISVLVIDAAAPAGHIDRVVIEQFKLAVQLCDIVTGGRSRIENFVFEVCGTLPGYALCVVMMGW